LIGLLICGPFSVVAWIMASGDLRKMNEGIMDPRGRSNTNTGRIVGMVGTSLWILVAAYFLLRRHT
jgi:hypothetical protein